MTTLETVLLIANLILAAAFISILVTANRQRSQLWKLLRSTGDQLVQTKAHLARAQEELRRATTRTVPVEPKPAATVSSLKKFVSSARSSATPAKTSSTSRTSDPSTDTLNAGIIGSTLYSGSGWSSDSGSSSSCDTSSSSSSSSDGGSCGGGE